jgi:hypothetical protein
MRRVIVPALLAVCALLEPHTHEPVRACGSAALSDVGELTAPPRTLVAELLADPWEGSDEEDFRFLRPFELAGKDPRGLLALARGAGDDGEAGSGSVLLDLTGLREALEGARLADAEVAAQSAVDAVLNMPAPVAGQYGSELREAVEVLELAPHLAGLSGAQLRAYFVQREGLPPDLPQALRDAAVVRRTPRAEFAALLAKMPDHPRAASLSLAVLAERAHAEIPSGWPGEIEAPDAVWSRLLGDHDAWIAAHPAHPLLDLARLQKLRVLYLRGDARAAWALLLELYPRRPLRAAWEMRHLLLNDQKPSLDVSTLRDPVLASALVRESNELSPKQWSALWKRASEWAASRWAENLEQRLLVQAIRLAKAGKKVQLPPVDHTRGKRWMVLRGAALLAQGRADDAIVQVRSLAVRKDRPAARVLSQALLVKCDLSGLAEAAELVDPDTSRYAREVLLDEPALRSLAQRDDLLGARAANALGLRKLGRLDFAASASALTARPARERGPWQDAARRTAEARTPEQKIALAKWLLGPAGVRLFGDKERAFSRGLKARLDTLTRGPREDAPLAGCGLEHERARLEAMLLGSGRREQALALYVAALGELEPRAAKTRRVLAEADALYNKLLHWDASWSEAYPALLAASPEAIALRELGKRVRER